VACQNCSGESYDVVTTGAVWRGVLCQDFGAAQWTAWFGQYSAFIVHYASLAQEAGADEYFVTHELATCEQYGPAALWGRLIDDVRAVFHGKVAAALNWGPFVTGQIVPTWTAKLDYIGVDCYFDLNVTFDRNDPRWYGRFHHVLRVLTLSHTHVRAAGLTRLLKTCCGTGTRCPKVGTFHPPATAAGSRRWQLTPRPRAAKCSCAPRWGTRASPGR
jgi:hypothetical protein